MGNTMFNAENTKRIAKVSSMLRTVQAGVDLAYGLTLAQQSPEDLRGQYILGTMLTAFARYKENNAKVNNFGKYGSMILSNVGTALTLSADYQRRNKPK